MRAEVGQKVNVSVFVYNSGDVAGECEIPLQINGSAFETRKVTLAPKSGQRVSFTVPTKEAGSYTGNIGSLSAAFKVTQKTGAMPNWLIGLIAGLVVIAAAIGLTVILIRRKKPPAGT